MTIEHGLAATLEETASKIIPCFELAIVAVLWRRRSLTLFRFLAIYLITDAIRNIVLWLTGSAFSSLYKVAWVYSEPAILILYVLMTWELMLLLYKVYPGIHSFGKLAIGAAVLVASVTTLISDPTKTHTEALPINRTLLQLIQGERVLDSGLVLVIAVTLILFPQNHYAKNVKAHGVLLCAFFATQAAGLLAITYGFDSELSNLLPISVQLILYPVWIRLFLAPEPERLPVRSSEEIARTKQRNEDLLFLARWLTRKG